MVRYHINLTILFGALLLSGFIDIGESDRVLDPHRVMALQDLDDASMVGSGNSAQTLDTETMELIRQLEFTFARKGNSADVFEAARLALEYQGQGVYLEKLDQATVNQLIKLNMAETLSELEGSLGVRDLRSLVEHAKEATRWQTRILDLDWEDADDLYGNDGIEELLLALTERNDISGPERRAFLDRLDEIPEHLNRPLTEILQAYIAFESAAGRISYHGGADSANFLSKPDLAGVFSARNRLLDSVMSLHEVLGERAVSSSSSCEPIQVASYFSIDLTHCDNTYREDFRFLLDLGGNDTYRNNAGGNNVGDDCHPDTPAAPAAALVDLGPGNDTMGEVPIFSPEARCGGANGGGLNGVGFLFNERGHTVYGGTKGGVNGGGSTGAGFLLDAEGNDEYHAAFQGTNGGAFQGIGLLVDSGGNDLYNGSGLGSNGGANLFGIGGLIDLIGDDVYRGDGWGTNGGGMDGHGMILDLEGRDTYVDSSTASNGGASGDGATGLIVDLGGDDVYNGSSGGVNGGARWFSVGMLVDQGGNDQFRADNIATNGGASIYARGYLIVDGGNNSYTAGNNGTNGGARWAGSGFLLDNGMHSVYDAGSSGTNGGGLISGNAILIDLQGHDRYLAGSDGTNGGTGEGGYGLLFDGGGQDSYRDNIVECTNCSVLPKGNWVGAQLDIKSLREV